MIIWLRNQSKVRYRTFQLRYSRATYNLGKMYELGVGVERDSVKAAKLFQQVAEFADDAKGRFASRA